MPFEPEEEKQSEVDIIDAILDAKPSQAAMGPGGTMFSPLAFEPIGLPDFIPENVICLRGPCKHYWESKLFFESGNTVGTMPEAPKYTQRACLRQPGIIQNLNDDVVFECSEWEPLNKSATAIRDSAREEFYQTNPQFRPGKENK